MFHNYLFSLAAQEARLWLDTSCVNAAIVNTFKSACNRYHGSSGNKNNKKTGGDTSINNQTHEGLDVQVEGPAVLCKASPVTLAKAVKNHAEIEGMKNSHLR